MIYSDEIRKRYSENKIGFDKKERGRVYKLEPIETIISPTKKEGRIEIIDKIQRMCIKLENTFESTSSLSSANRKIMPKDLSNNLQKRFSSKVGISVPQNLKYIISELRKRIKSLPLKTDSIISPNRFNNHHEGSEKNIGPGKYLNKDIQKVESHEFSLIPRLKSPISHNISCIESQYPNKKNVSDERIRHNKFLVEDFDEYKNKKKQQISNENLKISLIKYKRRLIDEQKHGELLKKLNRKSRLFEWRMMKEEVQSVKQTWILLYFVAGIPVLMLAKRKKKKLLRGRWEIILRKVGVVFKFAAKFISNLNKIRKRFVELRLKKLSGPFGEYAKEDLLNKKKVLQRLVDEYFLLPEISKLMVKIKFLVVKLQRHSRNFLKIQESRKKVLRLLWDKLYSVYIRKKPEKLAAFERLGHVSREIVDTHIHNFLKKSLKLYASDMKIYTLDPASSHSKPVLKLFIKQEKLLILIEYALKIKEHTLKQQKLKKFKKDVLSLNSKSS